MLYDLVPLGYVLWNYKLVAGMLYVVKKQMINFCLLYVAIVIWALIVIGINDGDFTYFDFLLRIIQNILLYLFMWLFSYKMLREISLDSFLKYFIVATCLYVFFSVVFLLNPDWKEFWAQLLVQNDLQLRATEDVSYQTRFGLKGFSNFGETAMCSLAALSSLYLMHKEKIVLNIWMVAFIICLLGSLFYGRSGVITSVMFFVLYELGDISMVNIKRLFVIVFTLTLLIMLTIGIAEYDLRLQYWLMWVSAPVESFIFGLQYGQISFGHSTNRLVNEMYFVPDDDTLLLGDAHYMNSDGSYYMGTDVGILRHVLYYGIFGELLGYSLIAMPVFWLMRIFYTNKDKLRLLMIMLFVPFIVFFEAKGVIYNSFFGWLIIMLVLGKNEYLDKEKVEKYDE